MGEKIMMKYLPRSLAYVLILKLILWTILIIYIITRMTYASTGAPYTLIVNTHNASKNKYHAICGEKLTSILSSVL